MKISVSFKFGKGDDYSNVNLREVNMFLALTNVESFASLVSLVVGLFAFLSGRKQTKLTTRSTSDANDFVNANSHAGKKPLHAG